jgi:5-methylcytosine-specific restriction endonuclease McrA
MRGGSISAKAARLSEHAAYHRIEAARAARQFPGILPMVRDGWITTTTVAMLRPHLTPDNHEVLLTAARHRTKREVEHQIACLAPKPDATSMIRRVSLTATGERADFLGLPAETGRGQVTSLLIPTPLPVMVPIPAAAPVAPPMSSGRPGTISDTVHRSVQPLAADRYLLRVTLGADGHTRLRRAQDLMRHTNPTGDPALIIDRALTLLVDQLERTKIARVSRPRQNTPRSPNMTSVTSAGAGRSTRHIPAAVKRRVWARDEGRCAFVGPHGRCTETGRLEFHHIQPFAHGGQATVDNIALRCRAHNGHKSDRVFGHRTR